MGPWRRRRGGVGKLRGMLEGVGMGMGKRVGESGVMVRSMHFR